MAQDDYIRTALRVPPDLHKALHEAAEKNGKSFNAEILGRLQGSFEEKVSTSDLQIEMRFADVRLEHMTLNLEAARVEGRLEGARERAKELLAEDPSEETVKKIEAVVEKIERERQVVLTRLSEVRERLRALEAIRAMRMEKQVHGS